MLVLLNSIEGTYRITMERNARLNTKWSQVKEYIRFRENVTLRVGTTQSERSGSVVECFTRDRETTYSSLTGVTVLCP